MNVFFQGAALLVCLVICTGLWIALTAPREGLECDDYQVGIAGWWILPGLMAGLLLIGVLIEVAL